MPAAEPSARERGALLAEAQGAAVASANAADAANANANAADADARGDDPGLPPPSLPAHPIAGVVDQRDNAQTAPLPIGSSLSGARMKKRVFSLVGTLASLTELEEVVQAHIDSGLLATLNGERTTSEAVDAVWQCLNDVPTWESPEAENLSQCLDKVSHTIEVASAASAPQELLHSVEELATELLLLLARSLEVAPPPVPPAPAPSAPQEAVAAVLDEVAPQESPEAPPGTATPQELPRLELPRLELPPASIIGRTLSNAVSLNPLQDDFGSQLWALESLDESAPPGAPCYIACPCLGYVLEVAADEASPDPWATSPPLRLWYEKRGRSEQLWRLTPDGFVVSEYNGHVLDTKGETEGNGAEGVQVILFESMEPRSRSQRWTLDPAGRLRSRQSPSLALDALTATQKQRLREAYGPDGTVARSTTAPSEELKKERAVQMPAPQRARLRGAVADLAIRAPEHSIVAALAALVELALADSAATAGLLTELQVDEHSMDWAGRLFDFLSPTEQLGLLRRALPAVRSALGLDQVERALATATRYVRAWGHPLLLGLHAHQLAAATRIFHRHSVAEDAWTVVWELSICGRVGPHGEVAGLQQIFEAQRRGRREGTEPASMLRGPAAAQRERLGATVSGALQNASSLVNLAQALLIATLRELQIWHTKAAVACSDAMALLSCIAPFTAEEVAAASRLCRQQLRELEQRSTALAEHVRGLGALLSIVQLYWGMFRSTIGARRADLKTNQLLSELVTSRCRRSDLDVGRVVRLLSGQRIHDAEHPEPTDGAVATAICSPWDQLAAMQPLALRLLGDAQEGYRRNAAALRALRQRSSDLDIAAAALAVPSQAVPLSWDDRLFLSAARADMDEQTVTAATQSVRATARVAQDTLLAITAELAGHRAPLLFASQLLEKLGEACTRTRLEAAHRVLVPDAAEFVAMQLRPRLLDAFDGLASTGPLPAHKAIGQVFGSLLVADGDAIALARMALPALLFGDAASRRPPPLGAAAAVQMRRVAEVQALSAAPAAAQRWRVALDDVVSGLLWEAPTTRARRPREMDRRALAAAWERGQAEGLHFLCGRFEQLEALRARLGRLKGEDLASAPALLDVATWVCEHVRSALLPSVRRLRDELAVLTDSVAHAPPRHAQQLGRLLANLEVSAELTLRAVGAADTRRWHLVPRDFAEYGTGFAALETGEGEGEGEVAIEFEHPRAGGGGDEEDEEAMIGGSDAGAGTRRILAALLRRVEDVAAAVAALAQGPIEPPRLHKLSRRDMLDVGPLLERVDEVKEQLRQLAKRRCCGCGTGAAGSALAGTAMVTTAAQVTGTGGAVVPVPMSAPEPAGGRASAPRERPGSAGHARAASEAPRPRPHSATFTRSNRFRDWEAEKTAKEVFAQERERQFASRIKGDVQRARLDADGVYI